MKVRTYLTGAGVLATAGVIVLTGVFTRPAADVPRAGANTTAKVVRRDFVRSRRLNGTVEAVESTSIPAPRLAGQNNNSLVIMRLVNNGATVKPGDVLVEFDRQDQIRNALDRKADLTDLEQQIKKAEAEEVAAKASDESALQQARDAEAKAKLELIKNDLLPKIEAEKNTLAYEQAQATLQQLQESYGLKRAAAAANIKGLEIKRDRSETTMKQAESNAEKMLILSPLPGVAVIKTTWKNGGAPVEFIEGDEVRPGQPVVEVVNPAAMRVRARVNQADVNELQVGQPVRVGLDAYPSLSFDGTITQISPIAQQSTLSPKVRTFVVLVLVNGSHPNLMPDLTASLDVQLERTPGALVVPRDALVIDGEQAYAMVQRGGRFERQDVTVGTVGATEAIVSSGLQEGVTIARNAAALVREGRRR
ncbi:MAG TPA: HlyD family efflux transporter periplasmic adaptor subunit [Vicinamibacterales bacterium]|jgi:HlyD family secretion protein|nr:HlyD family efflux transporter periplasmic adaptor subunit [Vicinamibacterales bacterium]